MQYHTLSNVAQSVNLKMKSPRMIRTVLFDMGNVLLHFSHERMYRQMAEVCGLLPEKIREIIADGDLLTAYESGWVSEQEFHGRFEEAAGRRIDFDRLAAAACDIFWANDEMLPIVESLRRQGTRLVLMSNTNRAHFQFVRERFPVLGQLDHWVLSYEVGAMKPRPEIYQAALAAIDCRPEECLYTDDIPAYIEAARAFGLQAEVFTTASAFAAHLEKRTHPPKAL
jgi:glucose-1-phosphatase